VTIANFTNNNSSITILAISTATPITVNPPAGTAAFVITNSSVNLLNINTITSVTNRSGARFGFATSTASVNGTAVLPFVPGRNVQFTANYSF